MISGADAVSSGAPQPGASILAPGGTILVIGEKEQEKGHSDVRHRFFDEDRCEDHFFKVVHIGTAFEWFVNVFFKTKSDRFMV